MQSGELVQWNDSRGFGFILADNGERYFVHISNIGRIATRPREGDLVSFRPGKSNDGRLEAKSVAILGANPKPTLAQLRRGTGEPARSTWRVPVAGLFAALIVLGLALGQLPLLLAGLYVIGGLLSFAAYANDKRFAESGQWRISEATLLGLDLCFGIVGGLLGQEVFRHKTRKESYVGTTMFLVGVHVLWLLGFATGFIRVEELSGLVTEIVSAFR